MVEPNLIFIIIIIIMTIDNLFTTLTMDNHQLS